MSRSGAVAPSTPEIIEQCGHSYAASGGAMNPYLNGNFEVLVKLLRPGIFRKMSIGGARAAVTRLLANGDGGWNWVLQNMKRPGYNVPNGASGVPFGFRWRPSSQIFIPWIGENDLATTGKSFLAPFETAYRTILSRACHCWSSDCLQANWTRTGTWAQVGGTVFGSTTAIVSSVTVNDYVDVAIPAGYPGGRVFAIGLFVNATKNSTVRISVDGVDLPDITIDGPSRCESSSNHNMHTVRLNTPSAPHAALNAAGAHTIRLKLVGGTAPQLAPDFVAVESDPADGPCFVIPKGLKPKGYDVWSGFAHGPNAGVDPINDAALDFLDQRRAVIAAEFSNKVAWIDCSDIPRTQDYWYEDNTHPSARTHKIIALRMAEAIRYMLTPRLQQGLDLDTRNGAVWTPIGGEGGPAFGTSNGTWTNVSGALAAGINYEPLAFHYDILRNRVRVKGAATKSTTASSVIFTFPAGLRTKNMFERPMIMRDGAAGSTMTFAMIRMLPIGSGYDGQLSPQPALSAANGVVDLSVLEFEPEG